MCSSSPHHTTPHHTTPPYHTTHLTPYRPHIRAQQTRAQTISVKGNEAEWAIMGFDHMSNLIITTEHQPTGTTNPPTTHHSLPSRIHTITPSHDPLLVG